LQVSEKRLENATIELQVEVPENRIEVEYKSVFNRIQREAKVAGFRKGKVPLKIIEQKFKEKADYEVVENLLRSVYLEVVTEKKLTPVSKPEFDFKELKRGKSFSFKVKFEVAPTVELAHYKNLSVVQRSCIIKDKDIDREVQSLREKNADISKKGEGESVENGDLVKIEVKRIDNMNESEIEKADFKEFSIIVGKSKEDYTFDNYIVGMKEGEEKEVEIKYPKKYEVKDLAGQRAVYIVKIAEINNMILPELDDEFAKDLGEYTTVEELRKGIGENLKRFVDERSKSEAKAELLKEVVKDSIFDIPETMIKNEMEASFQRFQQRIGFFARDINDFTSKIGINADDFVKNLRTEATESIKSTLVLSELARKEQLKVDEERYREVVENLAKQNNKTVEEIEKLIEENNSRENIESELVLEQALELLYTSANLKRSKAVSLEEFVKAT
jgi:trigger factor